MNIQLTKKILLNGLLGFLFILNTAWASVSVTPSLTDGATIVSTGVPIVYQVRFTNDGTEIITPLDGYRFQVELPIGTSVISTTCTVGNRCASISTAGQILNMTLNTNLAPGQVAGFDVRLMPLSTLVSGVSLATTASFIAPDNSVLGSVTDINTVTRQTVNYNINKTTNGSTNQARYAPGQRVSYRLGVTLTSTGGNLPIDVPISRITDTIPPELTNVTWSCDYPFISGSTNLGCSPQTGIGNTLDVLAGGGSGTSMIFYITVTGDLSNSVPIGTTISNTATANAISPSPLQYASTAPKNGTATFLVEDANTVRYNLTKSESWSSKRVAQGATGQYYQVTFYNYGPATFTGQLSDVIQNDIQLTNINCRPQNGLGDCGAGVGVTYNNNAPSSQTVNQNLVVPPGEIIYLVMTGNVVGPVGTQLNNTATLTPIPGLVMQNLSNVISSTPSISVTPSTIVGVLDITATVRTLPDTGLSSLNTAIGSMPSYQITFQNQGTSDATNLRLSSLKSGPDWNLQSNWTCTAYGGAVCPASNGTGTTTDWIAGASNAVAQIPAGDRLVFTIIPTIPIPSSVVAPNASSASIYTYARVTNNDTNFSLSNSLGSSGLSNAFTTIVRSYNANITKSSGVSALVAGDPVSYTININNNNNLAQPNLRVIDPLNNNVTNANWTCTACNPSTGTGDIDTLANIPANGSISIHLTGNVNPRLAPNSTLINTASLVDSDNNTFSQATDTINISAVADIGVTKTANLSTYSLGINTPVTYTIQVTNHGPSTAVGTPITDNAPAGVTFNSWSCDICALTSGTGNINTIADIAQNQTATLIINATVTASATGILTNTALSSNPAGYLQDTNSNHPKTASASLLPQIPELTLIKLATPSSFIVGAPASYTLTVTNNGTGPTTATTTVTDTIPTGLTIGTLPANCNAVGQTITCTIAAGLISGTSQSFTIPVTATISAIGSVTNTATVSGGGDTTCPAAAHCNSSISSNVNAPQLLLEKTAGNSTFVIGVQNSYTLKITNQGTAATTAPITVTDTLPNVFTLGTLPSGCSNIGLVVTCTIPTGLAAGSYVSFIIPVTPTVISDATNTAVVSGGGDIGCPTAARCTSEITSNISAPQLSINKTTIPSTLVLGQAATYRITITNTGAAATTTETQIIDHVADAVTLNTPLPEGCTLSARTITCIIPSGLQAGSFVNFDLPVTPTVSGTPLSNTASVIGGGDPTCGTEGDCSSTITINVSAPQLRLIKTASSADFIVGQAASYTLSVLNEGDAATTLDATLVDIIPAQLDIDTLTLPIGCTAINQQVTCIIPAGLAAGATTSFVIPVTPNSEAAGIVNTATVSGGGDPGCPANTARCSSSVTTDFNVPALSMSKSPSTTFFTVGLPAFYTLTVTNNGSSATTEDAIIHDSVPAILTLGTLPSGCSNISGQSIECVVTAGLATGASQSFIIPITPNTASYVNIVNSAVVSGGGDPGCPTEPRCTSNEVESLVLITDLRLNKTSSTPNFVLGVPASYTITLTNQGTAVSNTIATVTDTLPSELNIDNVSPDCSITGQTVSCTVAAGFGIGESRDFIIDVTPIAIGTALTNTAYVMGGDPSCVVPLPSICYSNTVTLNVQSPSLTVDKISNLASMPVGATASYTLNVTNAGSAATTAVTTVTDTFDAVFTIDATTLPSACLASGQTVTCTIPAGLLPLQTVGFTINVTPSSQATGIGNIATVYGGGDPACSAIDPCSSNNLIVDIINGAEITINKTISQTTLAVNTPVTYTIDVRNIGIGPTDAELMIVDNVPEGLEIQSVSAGCTVVNQEVTCRVASGLSNSSSQQFEITTLPTAALPQGEIINTVSITSAGSSIRCSGSCNSSAVAMFSITSTVLPIPFVPAVILLLMIGSLMLLHYYFYRQYRVRSV